MMSSRQLKSALDKRPDTITLVLVKCIDIYFVFSINLDSIYLDCLTLKFLQLAEVNAIYKYIQSVTCLFLKLKHVLLLEVISGVLLQC